ncbi:hypothetical protein IO43_11170 [Gallibacterium anatis 7990]|nr:hypothetical protein IO43_11170 [Gallibacterium anatis 7990]
MVNIMHIQNKYLRTLVNLLVNLFYVSIKIVVSPIILFFRLDFRDYKEKRLDDINANLEKQNALLKEQIKQMQSDSNKQS